MLAEQMLGALSNPVQPSRLDKVPLPVQIRRDVVSQSTFGHRRTDFPFPAYYGHRKIFVARNDA